MSTTFALILAVRETEANVRLTRPSTQTKVEIVWSVPNFGTMISTEINNLWCNNVVTNHGIVDKEYASGSRGYEFESW